MRRAVLVAAGLLAVAETSPGDTALWRGTLKPGRYKLYCSLPGHAAAGMRATLRVR